MGSRDINFCRQTNSNLNSFCYQRGLLLPEGAGAGLGGGGAGLRGGGGGGEMGVILQKLQNFILIKFY